MSRQCLPCHQRWTQGHAPDPKLAWMCELHAHVSPLACARPAARGSARHQAGRASPAAPGCCCLPVDRTAASEPPPQRSRQEAFLKELRDAQQLEEMEPAAPPARPTSPAPQPTVLEVLEAAVDAGGVRREFAAAYVGSCLRGFASAQQELACKTLLLEQKDKLLAGSDAILREYVGELAMKEAKLHEATAQRDKAQQQRDEALAQLRQLQASQGGGCQQHPLVGSPWQQGGSSSLFSGFGGSGSLFATQQAGAWAPALGLFSTCGDSAAHQEQYGGSCWQQAHSSSLFGAPAVERDNSREALALGVTAATGLFGAASAAATVQEQQYGTSSWQQADCSLFGASAAERNDSGVLALGVTAAATGLFCAAAVQEDQGSAAGWLPADDDSLFGARAVQQQQASSDQAPQHEEAGLTAGDNSSNSSCSSPVLGLDAEAEAEGLAMPSAERAASPVAAVIARVRSRRSSNSEAPVAASNSVPMELASSKSGGTADGACCIVVISSSDAEPADSNAGAAGKQGKGEGASTSAAQRHKQVASAYKDAAAKLLPKQGSLGGAAKAVKRALRRMVSCGGCRVEME